MIEFQGLYYSGGNKNPMTVLIQFDGRHLHVWHLADPFFRLRSSLRFTVRPLNKKSGKMIKFPDGAYIKSEHDHDLNRLMEKTNVFCASRGRIPCKKGAIVFIACMILLLIGAGWSILI